MLNKTWARVDRAVSFLERDGQRASAVNMSRSFATSIEDLWDAVTNAERIQKWFTPVSGVLEPGGRYQLEGNASGAITACERLSHFALTWEFGGDVSWVDVSLAAPEEGQSRLTLTHTAILSAHWGEYGPGAAGVGWEWGMLGLAIHPGAAETANAGRDGICRLRLGQGILRRQQRRLGESGDCGGNGFRHCACGCEAHDRLLYRRTGGNFVMARHHC